MKYLALWQIYSSLLHLILYLPLYADLVLYVYSLANYMTDIMSLSLQNPPNIVRYNLNNLVSYIFTLLQSTQLYQLGNIRQYHTVVVFPWARNFTHIAPAYPAVMGAWQMLALIKWGRKGWTHHENLLH